MKSKYSLTMVNKLGYDERTHVKSDNRSNYIPITVMNPCGDIATTNIYNRAP